MIKRRHTHLLFALVSTSLGIAFAWQIFNLRQAENLNLALAAVPESLKNTDALPELLANHTHDELKIAVGSALGRGGNLEQAERLLNPMAVQKKNLQMRGGAKYNLANTYLRKALEQGTETTSQSLPLVELAKQHYRDLLREAPGHWQARHNLERALQIAPEGTNRSGDERIDPVKSVNVIVPGFEKLDLP